MKDAQAGVLLMVIVCVAFWSAILVLLDRLMFQ